MCKKNKIAPSRETSTKKKIRRNNEKQEDEKIKNIN